jgi:RimJ/RimL family protein N-acetyltransferase
MANQSNPVRSQRLTYRAFNSPADDAFFHTIQSDPVAFRNSCSSVPRPADLRFTEKIRHSVLESSLLFVVICLNPSSASSPSLQSAPTDTTSTQTSKYAIETDSARLEPIGTAFLRLASPDMTYHRTTELGIDIISKYQGQGYGTETIHWVLEWAFKSAGLHRVELTVLGWNEGARRLYKRVGFVEEGRKRACLCTLIPVLDITQPRSSML